MIEKRLFSFKETMTYLGLSRTSMDKLIKEGKLRNVSISHSFKFDKYDLDSLIEAQKKTILELKAS